MDDGRTANCKPLPFVYQTHKKYLMRILEISRFEYIVLHLFKSAGLQKLIAAAQARYRIFAVAVILLHKHILRAACCRFFKYAVEVDVALPHYCHLIHSKISISLSLLYYPVPGLS